MLNDYKQQVRQLALEKVDQIIQMLDKDKKIEFGLVIREFCERFVMDSDLFHHLYQAYKRQLQSIELSSQEIAIFYRHEDGVHTITFFGKSFSLDEVTYVYFLTSIIEMTREMLPLGTVVELDRTFFKAEQQPESDAKIVITGRYIVPKNYTTYFPYCGVLYPFGEIKKDTQLHFTPQLIKNVLHLGFKDDAEEAFELIMKKELIVDKRMQSIEFSVPDMKKLKKEIELKQNAGEY
jgi:hypothetical protein